MGFIKGRYVRGILLILLSGLLTAFSVTANTDNVVIVANTSVQSQSLNPSQLRSIFSMRQNTWPDGQPIKVYVFARNSDIHQVFCKEVLRMFPYQVERIWNKLTYSGLGELPILVGSEQEMTERIHSEPGAIGYLLASSDIASMRHIEVVKE